MSIRLAQLVAGRSSTDIHTYTQTGWFFPVCHSAQFAEAGRKNVIFPTDTSTRSVGGIFNIRSKIRRKTWPGGHIRAEVEWNVMSYSGDMAVSKKLNGRRGGAIFLGNWKLKRTHLSPSRYSWLSQCLSLFSARPVCVLKLHFKMCSSQKQNVLFLFVEAS